MTEFLRSARNTCQALRNWMERQKMLYVDLDEAAVHISKTKLACLVGICILTSSPRKLRCFSVRTNIYQDHDQLIEMGSYVSEKDRIKTGRSHVCQDHFWHFLNSLKAYMNRKVNNWSESESFHSRIFWYAPSRICFLKCMLSWHCNTLKPWSVHRVKFIHGRSLLSIAFEVSELRARRNRR